MMFFREGKHCNPLGVMHFTLNPNPSEHLQ